MGLLDLFKGLKHAASSDSSSSGAAARETGNSRRDKNTEPETAWKAKTYAKLEQIGEGAYGTVHRCVHLPTRRQYALKEFYKRGKGAERDTPPPEVRLLEHLYHPHIAELVDWFETKKKWHLVFELATGGELLERIVERGWYRERDAAVVSATFLNAIAFLHEHGIVHRDLKTANLLFKSAALDSPMVIVDFGLSRAVENPDDLLKTYMVGTEYYQAPEVANKIPYSGFAFDMWNAGEIVYTLLCGFNPFFDATPMNIHERMKQGSFTFPERTWRNISEDAKDFIRALMNVDPKQRPTARQALEHRWIVDRVPAEYLAWLHELNAELMLLEKEEREAAGDGCAPAHAQTSARDYAEAIKAWNGFREGVVPPAELRLPTAPTAQEEEGHSEEEADHVDDGVKHAEELKDEHAELEADRPAGAENVDEAAALQASQDGAQTLRLKDKAKASRVVTLSRQLPVLDVAKSSSRIEEPNLLEQDDGEDAEAPSTTPTSIKTEPLAAASDLPPLSAAVRKPSHTRTATFSAHPAVLPAGDKLKPAHTRLHSAEGELGGSMMSSVFRTRKSVSSISRAETGEAASSAEVK